MFTVGGLVQGLAEVLVHYPGYLPDVVGVEDHVPGQVLSCPLQILLTVALPVTTENISGFWKIFQGPQSHPNKKKSAEAILPKSV